MAIGETTNWDTPTNKASQSADGGGTGTDARGSDGEIDWLMVARTSHSSSTSFLNSDMRTEWEDNLRMFNNRHPQGSKYGSDAYKHRSKIFRPKSRAALRKDEAATAAAFFATGDLVDIQPEDESDPMQAANAVLMDQLLQYRLTKTIPWFLTVIGARQDSNVVGHCVGKLTWNYLEEEDEPELIPEIDEMTGMPILDDAGMPLMTEQKRTRAVVDKPDIDLIAPENFRFDQGASWIDPIGTSPYLIELIPMTVGEVKERMKQGKSNNREPQWKELSDSEIAQAKTNDWNSTRQAREEWRPDSKETNRESIRDFDIVWVHANWVRIDGEEWFYYTLGTTEMLTDPELSEDVYPYADKGRPIVMGYSLVEAHKTYPSGKIHLTQQLQREINDITNQRIDNVRLAMNGRNLVRRGRRIDLEALRRSVPGHTHLVEDPETDIKFDRPPDVTASSYQEQDRLANEFDEVSGTFSQSSVASNRQLNETVGGMQLLNANANTVGDYDLRVFTITFVEPVLQMLIKMEQMYETDATVLALAAKRAQVFQRYGVDKVTDGLLHQEVTLTVNVGIGATDPMNRLNRIMAGIGAARDILGEQGMQKMNKEEVLTEIFGALGYKDANRFFDLGENPEIDELMGVIEQLQQALEGKQMEYEHKERLEGMKGDYKLEDRKMATAGMLTKALLDDDGAINLERMRQKGKAGQLIAGFIERDRQQRMTGAQNMALETMRGVARNGGNGPAAGGNRAA